MNRTLLFPACLGAALFLVGCETLPPDAERGPNGTMAYDVFVEASPPGARIEANGELAGTAPLHLKIFGDRDGTFHDFGADYYVVRALPIATNQFVQSRFFGTGRWFGPEDHIPKHIYFDMNQNTPAYPPSAAPVYIYPGPPVFYGPPIYYGRPYYYGPPVRFYFGPRFYHRHR